MLKNMFKVYKITFASTGSRAYNAIRELILFHYSGRMWSTYGCGLFLVQTTDTLAEVHAKLQLEYADRYEGYQDVNMKVCVATLHDTDLSADAASWVDARTRSQALLSCFSSNQKQFR